MLGLEKHTPFECIGQINESRLAFELCRRKGFTGNAMKMFIDEVKDFDVHAALNEYTTVNHDYALIPTEIASKILPLMTASAEASKEYISILNAGTNFQAKVSQSETFA